MGNSIEAKRNSEGHLQYLHMSPVHVDEMQFNWYITPTMKGEDGNKSKSVYQTSPKRCGETTFAKYITLAWCKFKRPGLYIDVSVKDLYFVQHFDFVFLVSLKESLFHECDINNMIYNQIIEHLRSSYPYNILETYLRNRRCLIVLDGLDEWRINPHCIMCERHRTPHTKSWGKITYLTTSSEEKLESLKLKKEKVSDWAALKWYILEDIKPYNVPRTRKQYEETPTESRSSALENKIKHLNVKPFQPFRYRLIAHYRKNALKDGEEDILKHMNRKCNFMILPKTVPVYKLGSPWQAGQKLNDRILPKVVSSFVESISLDCDESKRSVAVTGKPKEIEEAYIDILTTWINLVENGPREDSVDEEYDAVLLLKGMHGTEYLTDINDFVSHSLTRMLGCSLEEIEYEVSRWRKCLVLLSDTIRTDIISTLQVKNPYFVIHVTSTAESEKASSRFSLNKDRNVIITLKKNSCLTTEDGTEISKWIDKRLGPDLSGKCNHRLCFVSMKAETKVNVEAKHIDNIEIHNCDDHIYFIHGARNLQLHGISILDFVPSTTISGKLEHLSLYFEDCPGQNCCRTLSEKIIEDITTSVHKCSQLQVVELYDISIGRYKDISHSITRSTIQQIKQDTSIKSTSLKCSALLGPSLEKYLFDKSDFDLEKSSFAKGIIINSICHQLVTSEEAVLEAYAFEQQHTERPGISIACFTTANCNLPFSTYREFPVLQKQHNSVSTESILAEADTNDLQYDLKIYEEALNDAIGYNTDNLFSKHSNLEAVCGSRVRSTRSGINKLVPCIVLYCRWKGMIPCGEKKFPTELTDKKGKHIFATDVREGFFVFGPNGSTLTGGATDLNNELAMGCSIGPIQGIYSGTIGPFLNICGKDRTCFLTVRHIFQPFDLDDIRLRGTKIVQPADGDEVVSTQGTRNSKPTDERVCGEVLVSHFHSNVDAAVIKIFKDRVPKRGNFVGVTTDALQSAGFSQSNFPTFDNGKMMDATTFTIADHATERVIKFGRQTGLTRGSLDLKNMAVKIKDETKLSIHYNGLMREHVMKRQLKIKSYAGEPFFLRGDSGSAVFLVDKDNKLHCIAMAIGLLTDQSCVATPIKTIIEKFNEISPNRERFELKKILNKCKLKWKNHNWPNITKWKCYRLVVIELVHTFIRMLQEQKSRDQEMFYTTVFIEALTIHTS